MAKDTITMTRDLFDEMLIAVATKERERIIAQVIEVMGQCHPLNHLADSGYCSCEVVEAING